MITSRNNETIKSIRALRTRRERTATGLLFADGTHLVAEALQTGAEVVQLVGAPDRLRSPFTQELVQSAVTKGIPYLEVAEDVFDSLSDSEGRQGLGAVVKQKWIPLNEVHPQEGELWLGMNAVQYPGNLGTTMRTLDCVGGKGVILLGQSTDPYDPTALRASLGSVFSLKMIRTEVEELAEWKKQQGVQLVAADVGATEHYREVTYRSPVVLLMGAERDGLTPEQRALCDHLVHIPMVGRSDSLNLSVSASVVLYEIFHQLQESPKPPATRH